MKQGVKLNYIIIFVFLFFILSKLYSSEITQEQIEYYLLPDSHPAKIALDHMELQEDTFSNSKALIRHGFSDKNASSLTKKNRVYVFSHPLIEGYLIKTYAINKNDEHYKNALHKYLKRIKNADVIRNYIAKNHCQYLIVPKKWLYRLPENFNDSHSPLGKFLLIVESMDVLQGSYRNGDNGYHYYHMPEDYMYELISILYRLKGCDAWPHNIPFTTDDRLAFIDTEHLGKTFGDFLFRTLPALRPELQEIAKEYWKTQNEIESLDNFLMVPSDDDEKDL